MSAEPLFDAGERLVIIIGRGHSGTRAISQLVQKAGVRHPTPQNGSSDYTPKGNPMYRAARMAGPFAKVIGGRDMRFDFRAMVEDPIPGMALDAIRRYVAPVYEQGRGATWVGWKLPETTLCYPWMVRLFPKARFIWWLRDPRDVVLKPHGTDDLAGWGVRGCSAGNTRVQRIRSWLYQEAIVRETPRPRHLLRLTLERWAANQRRTLRLLGRFLPGTVPQGIFVDATTNRWRKQGVKFSELEMALMQASLRRHSWT